MLSRPFASAWLIDWRHYYITCVLVLMQAADIGPWELCTNNIIFYHDSGSMIPIHRELTKSGYRALIFRFWFDSFVRADRRYLRNCKLITSSFFVVKLNVDIVKFNVLAVAITICVCLTRDRRLGHHRLVTRSQINGGPGLLDVKLQGNFKVLLFCRQSLCWLAPYPYLQYLNKFVVLRVLWGFF